MTTATRLAKIRARVESNWGVGDEHFLLGQLDDACLALNVLRTSEQDLLACVVEMGRDLDALKERNAWHEERQEATGATLLKAQEENATLKAELAHNADVWGEQ